MAKIGNHLRVQPFGSDALGVNLLGNPQYPEPVFFFVTFPGGRVEITRTTNDEYWVHVTSDQPNQSDGRRADDRKLGKIIDARCDRIGTDPQDEIGHIAIRVTCDLDRNVEAHSELSQEIHKLSVQVSCNSEAAPLTTSPFQG